MSASFRPVEDVALRHVRIELLPKPVKVRVYRAIKKLADKAFELAEDHRMNVEIEDIAARLKWSHK